MKKASFLLITYSLILAIGFVAGRLWPSWTQPDAVVAENASPDGTKIATVIMRSGNYVFGIRSKNSPLLLLETTFVPQLGYHAPLIAVDWDKQGKRVIVTVDHDFGDNNLTYCFDSVALTWKTATK